MVSKTCEKEISVMRTSTDISTEDKSDTFGMNQRICSKYKKNHNKRIIKTSNPFLKILQLILLKRTGKREITSS